MAALVALFGAFALCNVAPVVGDAAFSSTSNQLNPIKMVVTLLEDMKTTCQKEGKADTEAYDKYMCWCETNEKEKTAAVKNAEERIAELNAFLEEKSAQNGETITQIKGLEDDIAEDTDALTTATAVRKKENEAFAAESDDMKETITLLGQALEVLNKVQLVQKPTSKDVQAANTALLQVREAVQRHHPMFRDVMQKDLFDVLDSLQGVAQKSLRQRQRSAFLGEVASLEIGTEQSPNSESGAASGAKSHNSRSGSIVGLLDQMKAEFSKNLQASMKQEHESEVSFQKLRAAKLAEIKAATEEKTDKEELLADTLDKMAKAKEDVASLEAAMSADQSFLAELTKNCKIEDQEYQARVKVRSEEIRALGEALKILTADDARELFGKTMGFLQVASSSSSAASQQATVSAQMAAENRLSERVMQKLAAVAKKHHNWSFLALAVRVRMYSGLDAFTKVKAAMDKMMAELQKQQKEEYAKWETCKNDIDQTEDAIKVGEETKKDLDEKHQDLTNTIQVTEQDIATLKKEVEDMEVSLKQAGEERKAQNQLFQSTMMDQRATINILNKVLARLKEFYDKSFVQVSSAHRQEPGAAAPPPPPRPADYAKSGTAPGVLNSIAMIIKDAEATEAEIAADEQTAQEAYSQFVQDTSAGIEADRSAIEQKEAQHASANSEKSATEESQLANDAELERLADLLKAHHMDCDFVLKYFDIRQEARQEEMDSINDAKAILSGANFGK